MSNVIPTGRFGKVCMVTIPMGIGQRFKELRESMFYSRDTMAWKLGLSVNTLKNYENGVRTTDLDAFWRFVRVFNDYAQERALGWLLYGGECPNYISTHTICGTLYPVRTKEVKFKETNIGSQIAMRVKTVREEAFNLGREEFVDKIKSSFSHATVSDYEQGRRSVTLKYCVELCNAATQPFEAWKFLLLGSEKPGAVMRAWFKIKNSSMSGGLSTAETVTQ